jgi:transcriptional regulator with XRE-family HTH domain
MTDERIRKLVAEKVQRLRARLGLTQEDMRNLGFAYRHYQRIEAGEKDLRLSTLNRLANAFKVPLRDLFDFD